MSSAAEPFHDVYESPFELRIVTACAMIGVMMQALDSTIANVALPYMQGGLGAARTRSPGC